METSVSDSTECVLIDDIIRYMVKLHILPYGVSQIINKMIVERDEQDGIDMGAARCIRMIKMVDDSMANKEKAYFEERGTEIILNFRTPKLTKYMNDNYSEKRYHFLYLAFQLIKLDFEKLTGREIYINMDSMFERVDKLDDFDAIEFGGYNRHDVLAIKKIKFEFALKMYNIFMAMCGNAERLTENYKLKHGYMCQSCDELKHDCTCDNTERRLKVLSYEHKYVFIGNYHTNDVEHIGYEGIYENNDEDVEDRLTTSDDTLKNSNDSSNDVDSNDSTNDVNTVDNDAIDNINNIIVSRRNWFYDC